MIGWLAKVCEELHRALGVTGSALDDLAKKVAVDQATTGESNQDSAGGEKSAGLQVDVLIGAEPLFHFVLTGNEARRVEDDHVELFTGLLQFAEGIEGVTDTVFVASGIEVVKRVHLDGDVAG